MAYTTIPKPTAHFNTKLYTGNASTNAITGVGFQPDMTWLKQRDGTPDHYLYDAVRGVLNYITPNLITQQQANVTSLTAFNSDGFTLGSNAATNANSGDFASWNWKANGQGSSNTDGTINTAYTSANTTSGFSISTYTGTGANATIGHGLGVAPQVVIYKRTNTTGNWFMYNKNIGNTKYLNLDATSAVQTYNVFQNTDPSSTLLYVSGDSGANASGSTYVAYCFAEKQGYSKFGSYAGNGNNDGAFVYTGFKPAWIMIKRTDSAESWIMADNKRDSYNSVTKYLEADANSAEGSGINYDFLSNGFKFNTTSQNTGGATYIYMVFAEEPLVSTNGIPATAR